jgi:hypothetical protein
LIRPAVVASLAISLLVSWAALHYDWELLIAGIMLLGMSGIALLCSNNSIPKAFDGLDETPVPHGLSDADKALFLLNRARRNARTALVSRRSIFVNQATNEIQAALVSSRRAYGIGDFSYVEAMTYRSILKVYLEYLDSFVPLLEAGHLAEAQSAARSCMQDIAND